MTDNATLKLEGLAEKQTVWRKMTPMEKLPYLEAAQQAMENLGPKGLEEILGERAADVKPSQDREIVSSEECLLAAILKTYIDGLVETYKVVADNAGVKEALMSHKKRVLGDQVIADIFPLLQGQKQGPFQYYGAEIWFQNGIKEADVEAFLNEDVRRNKDGVLCVLGSATYSALTVSDVLHGLFIRNQVVFCKLHPLRTFLQDFMPTIFEELYEDGFLYSEPDVSIERSQAIVKSEFVTAVHTTGSRATHELFTWGLPKDQPISEANTMSALKSEVTRKLGASPYIMTRAEYTAEELEHQAKTIVSGRWANGCACWTAPQVIIVSKHWRQREDFIAALEEAWKKAPSPSTGYNGASMRWKDFSVNYDTRTKVIRNGDQEEKEENAEINYHRLPLLLAFVDVNLSTSTGRAKAKSEYAFKDEVFAPVLAIVTVEDEDYMTKAVTLSNDYISGCLACSLAVPASAEGSAEVEQSIADLKYEAIVTNGWSAQSYLVWSLSCGGVYGDEELESAESKVGAERSCPLFNKVEKSVLRTPCTHPMHFDYCRSPGETASVNRRVAGLLMGFDPASAEVA